MNGLLSRCEKRDRLEPHVCCTADSLGYWHALHRAIHIRIRRCSERSRSFLCSLMLRDYSAGCTTVWSYRKALIWICCQHTVWCMDHSIWNMNLRGCMLLVTAQPHLGLKWHRTGLLTKCCKKKKQGGKKKSQLVCLCTHCIPGYLYRVKKLCRLHVSTWWELLNYMWMFLITSHKCWSTTLLQCLEEGGLIGGWGGVYNVSHVKRSTGLHLIMVVPVWFWRWKCGFVREKWAFLLLAQGRGNG